MTNDLAHKGFHVFKGPKSTHETVHMRTTLITTLAVAFGLASYSVSAENLAGVSPNGEVNPAGSFVQRVPVAVPNYHGLEPSVGLIYDSSFRDGPLGWGWRAIF
jgi:hypothetical protein